MLKLIDYWAPWCGPCKLMEPILAEIKKEFAGKVEVIEVNVDENMQEAQAKGIMSIPTYIVEKDGKEIARKVGFTPKEELKKLLVE